jgi:hypothetical protein
MSGSEFSTESSGSKSGDSGSTKKRRRNRRRSVKRRKGSSPSSEQGDKKQSEKQRVNERARSQRRRRRNRSSKRSTPKRDENQTTLKIDYVAPESVFIYTHVSRMDLRDSGYEYRPDHFSHSARQLEDFRIDISSILGTILDVEEGSRGFLKEFEWDDDLDEETVFERPEESDAGQTGGEKKNRPDGPDDQGKP